MGLGSGGALVAGWLAVFRVRERRVILGSFCLGFSAGCEPQTKGTQDDCSSIKTSGIEVSGAGACDSSRAVFARCEREATSSRCFT